MSFGGLTGISMMGCYWQYNKYLKSKHKWSKIFTNIDNNNPIILTEEEIRSKNKLNSI